MLPESLNIVTVTANGEVASLISAHLRSDLTRRQREGGFVYPRSVWDFVQGLEVAAQLVRAQRAGIARDIAVATAETLRDDTIDTDEELWTVRQVAEQRGCSASAVRARIARGTLPAHADDRGQWLVPRSAVISP